MLKILEVLAPKNSNQHNCSIITIKYDVKFANIGETAWQFLCNAPNDYKAVMLRAIWLAKLTTRSKLITFLRREGIGLEFFLKRARKNVNYNKESFKK